MIPQEYFDKVKYHFRGDTKKAWEWFQQSHPKCGFLSPLNMLKLDRGEKVKKLIELEMRK